MEEEYDRWSRIEDLFTRIPVDKLAELSDEALKSVKAGFHFAQAQFWIFFLLAYIGFAALSGNKWGKWLNMIFIAIGGWFALATPAADKLMVGDGWIAWLVMGFISLLIFIPKKSMLRDGMNKVWVNVACMSIAISTFFVPNIQDDLAVYFCLLVAYILYAIRYDRTRMRSAYLMLVSLFFYWKVGFPFVWILIFSTVVDFFLGKAVFNAKSDLKKKLFIALSMVTNLSMLAYFKYFKFFAHEWNNLVADRGFPDWLHIMNPQENAIGIWLNNGFDANIFLESLPMVVGISYYTFQTMSYTIDIYRGHIKPLNNIVDFGFFVSFFPQLVAGPIVRASEFVPQIHKEFSLSKKEFGWALYMILKGLVKKMVFADFIAVYFLDYVFADPLQFSGMANLIAIFGYSLQIYGDFAGYTDMAIGVAKLFGFQLPKNFNSPYKSIHCGEFWKRWHITLSSWLKDYLYIPLGGNRGGTKGSYIVAGLIIAGVLYAVDSWPTTVIVIGIIAALGVLCWYSSNFFNHINRNINVTLTMLLGGLWHGASWQFVIWGGLNGLGVLSTKYWLKFHYFQKAIVAVIIAAVMFGVKEITGNDIWILAVYWALVVGIVSFVSALVKRLFKIEGHADGRYLIVIWLKLLGGMLIIGGVLGAITWLQITGWLILGGSALIGIIKLRPTMSTVYYYGNAIWGTLHTLFFITFTRVYFRGESMEKIEQFYHQVLTNFKFYFGEAWIYAQGIEAKNTLDYGQNVFYVIALGYLVHWMPTAIKKRIESGFVGSHIAVQMVAAVVIAVVCYQAYSSDSAAFIYYQF